MTRTQECRNQLGWIEENCPLDRTSIIPIREAREFCDKHVEISTLATDAVQPLLKIKDDKVLETVVATLKTMIDSGKKPTRKVVMICIRENHQPQNLPPCEIQIQQNEKKIEGYRRKIDRLLKENVDLRECIARDSSKPSLSEPESFAIPETPITVNVNDPLEAQYLSDKPKIATKPIIKGFDAIRAKIARTSEPVRVDAT